MTDHATIQTRLEGRTAWITLDRPPLNVLNISMMHDLDSALGRLLPECDFVVFQGSGPKSFSAGAEVSDHVPERLHEMLASFHAIFRRLARTDCVTIAAVHGHCLGGGMELATFCDFLVAAESSKFAMPEIKLGCFPPVAMVTLPQLCGFRAAIDLILTGRTISAGEAHRLGLVSRVVPDAELKQGVDRLLEDLGKLSGTVLRLTRQSLWRVHAADFEEQLVEVERIYFDQLMCAKDAHEGLLAFMEKRAPVWQASR